MLKKTLVSVIVCLGLSSTVVSAGNAELKVGMGELSGSVSALQMGFFTNNKHVTLDAIKTLRANVQKYMGDKDTITKLLPQNVQYKASIAINSAEMIEKNAIAIEKALGDKSISMINRQMGTQKAFLEIQNQCFRCHNLVRDWE
ncbi:MAG: hypothetical protein U9N39_02195 [Campylobacterota bacterium]|nr:hypothetical protein [Campylobacterota bacterium]